MKGDKKIKGNKQITDINMVDSKPTISIVTLNTNGLSVSIKRQRLPEHINTHTHNPAMLSIRNPL